MDDGRRASQPRKWIAIGPKGGPYRIRALEKANGWFPDANELANARFYTEGVCVNEAVQELEA